MHLGLSCLLECLCNLVMSVVYVVTSPGWGMGFLVCRINSFIMEVIPVIYTLLLLNLVIDRLVCAQTLLSYSRAF